MGWMRGLLWIHCKLVNNVVIVNNHLLDDQSAGQTQDPEGWWSIWLMCMTTMNFYSFLSWTYLSSSISKLLSLSLSCLHRASLLSISRCSFLCRRMFSSRICRSSSMYCARFSVSEKQRKKPQKTITLIMKKPWGQLPLYSAKLLLELVLKIAPVTKFRFSYIPQCLNVLMFILKKF